MRGLARFTWADYSGVPGRRERGAETFQGAADMVFQCSSSLARRAALGTAGAALALLTGCVVAPVEAYDMGAPVVYTAPGYASYHGPAYYRAPYYAPYWGPSLSLGIHGGFGGSGGHWRGPPGRGGGHWQRPPSAGGGHWQRPPGAGGGHAPRPPGAAGGVRPPRPPAGGSRWQPGFESGSLGGGGSQGGQNMP
ncbi:hypothetical protein [Ottowia testudinis]|uniref:Uncharacterized protein n=1 Tax=Ottowia testudinis TaxID=2816950 RepID=A0A975CMQ3_9BURK|nr:hypothetical protein [Ottowia testudinis]QTD47024.1 hypothetical protein J1M35_09245 [Ottowia testudinis]